MKATILKLGILAIVSIFLIVILSSSLNPCIHSICPQGEVPKCPFPDGQQSTFFPHPNDCHWFFHCKNGVAYCMPCPFELRWNVELETCDYPYQSGCHENCGPGAKPCFTVLKNCPGNTQFRLCSSCELENGTPDYANGYLSGC